MQEQTGVPASLVVNIVHLLIGVIEISGLINQIDLIRSHGPVAYLRALVNVGLILSEGSKVKIIILFYIPFLWEVTSFNSHRGPATSP